MCAARARMSLLLAAAGFAAAGVVPAPAGHPGGDPSSAGAAVSVREPAPAGAAVPVRDPVPTGGAAIGGVLAEGRAGRPPSTVPVADPTSVTLRPDPSYQGSAFDGWGASLAWFANATGGYPDEIRNRLADLVFGADGLNLNIARYNIGGGNAPDVPDYLVPGAAVPGWWQAPSGTTRHDRDWWNPADPADWNLEADARQRWWVDRIKSRITRWEAFSNSPPYFQTVSGYVSGGFSGTSDQIRSDTVDDFAGYLATVARHLEQAHGIRFDSIDPLNEPNTNYWHTTLGADGNPTGGRQEGAHAGPALQQAVVQALAGKLAAEGSSTRVAAMDETNPGTFVEDWNAYGPAARSAVGRLNVHTYGTSRRTAVRDLAKGGDEPLWMSEVEGSWGGQDFTSMLPGLGMAQRIVDDLRELEPSAWLLWQPVENEDVQKPGGSSASGGNWGEIQVPFSCTATDTLASCPIRTNTKFDTIRNFTHYIRPGDHLLKTGDTASVAALSPGHRLSLVYVNQDATSRTVVLDLSGFARVAGHATVTPVVSSSDGGLVTGRSVPVRDRTATLEVPARSVTTLLVSGPVRGVADGVRLALPGHVYRLRGVGSDRSLVPSVTGTGLVIRTDDDTDPAQLWTLQRVAGPGAATPRAAAPGTGPGAVTGTGRGPRTGTGPDGDRARYRLGTADGTRVLAVVDGSPGLVAVTDPVADADPARWILSTTGDGTYTLVNVATGRLVDVSGDATADGSRVTTWTPTSGSNQRWQFVDETVVGVQEVSAFTPLGQAPTLPPTVVPVHRDGARGVLPVTWHLPAGRRWTRPGDVVVTGTVADVLGRTHRARARVRVDTLVGTLPARAKTYPGGAPTLPATVAAVTRDGYRTQRPVLWNPVPPQAYAGTGVVTVTGSADAGNGRRLPATLRLQVSGPVLVDAALAPGTTAQATFTEPGYSASALIDGDLTDKAWSNWQSGHADPTDTLTVTLPRAQDVAQVAVHFYSDGGRNSYPQTLQLQTRTDTGTWTGEGEPVTVPTGRPAPTVTVPIGPSAGGTRAVRVVLVAHPGQYMTASEIEVFARSPGRSSDATAASIAVDGVPLPGFSPEVTDYTVRSRRRPPRVVAEPTDPYAGVAIGRDPARAGSVTVTVTSEDGSATRGYTIHVV